MKATQTTSIVSSRDWLLQKFHDAHCCNPQVTMRAFARRLRIAPSTLSDLLAGKRPLTPKMFSRIADALKLRPAEYVRVLQMIQAEKVVRSQPPVATVNEISDRKFVNMDLPTFNRMCQWYYFGILALAEIEGATTTAEDIAKRLGISLLDAREAIRYLLRTKVLARSVKGLEPATEPLRIETLGYETAIKTFLKQMLVKGAEAIETVGAEYREVCSVVLAGDPSNIEIAREVLKRTRREVTGIMEQGSKSRVYGLSLQLIPLDHFGEEKAK